jgi:hypothetical protein
VKRTKIANERSLYRTRAMLAGAAVTPPSKQERTSQLRERFSVDASGYFVWQRRSPRKDESGT